MSKYHNETNPRQPSPVQTAFPTQRQAVPPLYRCLLKGGQSDAIELIVVVTVAGGAVYSGLSAQLDPRLFSFLVIPSRQHPRRVSAQWGGVVVVAVTVVTVVVVVAVVVVVVPTCTVGYGACSVVIWGKTSP